MCDRNRYNKERKKFTELVKYAKEREVRDRERYTGTERDPIYEELYRRESEYKESIYR